MEFSMKSLNSLPQNRVLLGLLVRQYRWGLSLRGWVFALLLLASVFFLFLGCIHPFFAITQRVKASLLVVEGWVPQYVMKKASEEFLSGSYQRVFSTGGPVTGMGGYINDYSTAAYIGATHLRNAGVPGRDVQSVPADKVERDRTYSAAVALQRWLSQYHPTERAVNIVTIDVHARRTRLLFQRAMGPEFQVGIVSIANPDYDSRHWWRYSEGVRDVLGETIAYAYVKVFFHP